MLLYFGTTNEGAINATSGTDTAHTGKFTLTQDGYVSEVRFWGWSTVGQYTKAIIYDDSSSEPNARKGVSDPLYVAKGSSASAAWHRCVFATPVYLTAGDYYIGIVTPATSVDIATETTGGTRYWNSGSFSYSSPPDPWDTGTDTTDSRLVSVFAVYGFAVGTLDISMRDSGTAFNISLASAGGSPKVTKSLGYAIRSTPTAPTKSLAYAIRPLIETLVENFDDNSIDTGEWGEYEPNTGTVTETNQRLQAYVQPSTSGSTAELYGINEYSLKGSSIFVNITQTAQPSVDTYFQLQYNDSSHRIGFIWDGGDLVSVLNTGSGLDYREYTTVSPGTDFYIRLREASGTTYWEYSTTGVGGTWNELDSIATSSLFDITELVVLLGVYEWASGAGTTNTTYFDNLNVGGTTTDSVTAGMQYAVQTDHSTTKTLAYAVERTPSAATKTLGYAIEKTHSVTKSLAYSLLSSSYLQRALAYAIQATATPVTKALAYVVAQVYSATKGIAYFVKSTQSDTKGLDYAIASTPSALTKGMSYAVVSTQSITKGQSYTVTSFTSVTLGLTYSILTEAPTTKGLTYAVKAQEGTTKALAYVILTTPSPTQKTLEYVVLAPTKVTLGLAYQVNATATPVTVGLTYDIETTSSTTKGLLYVVRSTVPLTKVLAYAISATVSAITKGLTYLIASNQSVTKGLMYSVTSNTSIQASMQYVIAGGSSVNLGLEYALLSTPSATTVGLDYAIASTAAPVTKSMSYAIEASTTVQAGLAYDVLSTSTIQRGMQYMVRYTVGKELLVDSYPGTNQSTDGGFSSTLLEWGQALTLPAMSVSKVSFWMRDISQTQFGNLTARIYNATGTVGSSAVPTGAYIAESSVVDSHEVLYTYTKITFTFVTPVSIGAGNYAITLRMPSAMTGYSFALDSTAPTHSGNTFRQNSSSWIALGGFDSCFEIYAAASGVRPTAALAYNVRSSSTIQVQLDYDVLGTTTEAVQLGMSYAVKSTLTGQLGMAYVVQAPSQVTKTMAYAVLRTQTHTKTLLYSINATQAILRSLEYAIVSAYPITKDLAYEVISVTTITKGMKYVVGDIHLYHRDRQFSEPNVTITRGRSVTVGIKFTRRKLFTPR